ncbi:MAG: 3'-5' exonuclease [Porphyromonas sp.]|nr:3'-5' exonuclease [Porphyromonas sp.]
MLYLKYLIMVVIPIALTAALFYRLYLCGKRWRAGCLYGKRNAESSSDQSSFATPSSQIVLLHLPLERSPKQRGKYLIIDVQTTGLFDEHYPENNPPLPLEVTLLLVDETCVPLCACTTLIYQEEIGSPEAVNVHGLTLKRVQQFGQPIETLAPLLHGYMEQSEILVGHNLLFDLSVIRHAFSSDTSLLTLMGEKEQICTMMLALEQLPEEVSEGKFLSLRQLARLFGAEWYKRESVHVSYANALYTLFVLKKLV